MRIILRFSSSTSRNAASQPTGPRRGFGLVEVIVAMILLAVAVTALAGLSLSVSQSSMKVTGSAYRNGLLMAEVNRLEALPYDSLHLGAVSYTTTGNYANTRYVTIAEPATNTKTVKLIIAPANPRFKPDTMNFTRTRARTTRVLNTTLP